MEKLFIIQIDWNLKGDTGHEVLAVTTAENAKQCFKYFVDIEKSETYLQDFFTASGKLRESAKDEIVKYTDTDTSFMLATSDYEYYTELSLIEKTIWKPNTEE